MSATNKTPFDKAARHDAHNYAETYIPGEGGITNNDLVYAHLAGADFARHHLASQKPTDAEVLAALNAHGTVLNPRMEPAPSLDYWGEQNVEAMRAALASARDVRATGVPS